MDYSFYGGQPGSPFAIAKTYISFREMNADFDNTECKVRYGEYVLIATQSIDDDDNGKLYQRIQGNDKYKYCGKIVGPKGTTPNIVLVSSDDYDPTDADSIGSLSLDASENADSKIQFYTKTTRVIDANNYETGAATTKIGLKIPAVQFKFNVESTSGETFANRVDDGTNVFYQEWDIQVPETFATLIGSEDATNETNFQEKYQPNNLWFVTEDD